MTLFPQEITDESDLTYMERGRLELELRKLKESKKMAEQYAVEAKQTAQRLSAENSKLLEDLSELTCRREIEEDACCAIVKSHTEIIMESGFKEEASAHAFELIHDVAGKRAHPRSEYRFRFYSASIIM